MTCEHAHAGLCIISTTLANTRVELDEKACASCMANKNPMTLNNVTCSRAAAAQRRAGMEVDRALYACVQDAAIDGPGTEFKKLIDLWMWWLALIPGFVRHLDEKTCGCDVLRVDMNTWGVSICREKREYILGKAAANAHKAFTLARWLPIQWQLGRLFERAMRNAGRSSVRRQSANSSRPA